MAAFAKSWRRELLRRSQKLLLRRVVSKEDAIGVVGCIRADAAI
jgi:hypothetical protein